MQVPISEFLRESVGNNCSAYRTHYTPNQDIISPIMLYRPFICCTAYSRSRITLQIWPPYSHTNLFTEPVDSSFSEQDDVMLSEPSETPLPKFVGTDNQIASTPLYDISFSSTPDFSASTIFKLIFSRLL